jgi:hypothetical protein
MDQNEDKSGVMPSVARATEPRSDRPANHIDADRAADDAPTNRVPGEDLKERQERLLDEAVEESFPASDPISPSRITK